MERSKLLRVTTIPESLNTLLKGQLAFLNTYFKVIGVSGAGKALEEVATREKVEVRVVNMEREISPLKDLKSLFRLIKLFKQEQASIVHTNTPKSSLLSMIAAKLVSTPCRIYTVTGLRFETATGIKRKILIWMEKVTCFCANHIVAESKGVLRMIEAHKLTTKKVDIIGNGNINGLDEHYWNPQFFSEADKEALRLKYGIQKEDFVFLFVGRLVKDKGVNELVKAFSKLVAAGKGNAKLLLVGPMEEALDPLPDDVQQTIALHPAIISVGYQSDVRSFMAISQALVLASYREGFPNVVLQAGAMELPCIVTNVNGAEEVIHEKNGIMVEKRNEGVLEKAMLRLLENYNDFDRAYCREFVIRYYSQEKYYQELLAFYNSILPAHS